MDERFDKLISNLIVATKNKTLAYEWQDDALNARRKFYKAKDALNAEIVKLLEEIAAEREAFNCAIAVIGNSTVTHLTGEHMNNVEKLNRALAKLPDQEVEA